MRHRNLALSLLSFGLLAVACTSSTSTGTPDVDGGASTPDGGGATPDGGSTTDDGGADPDAGEPQSLDFAPTNLGDVDLSGPLADIVLEGCGEQIRAVDQESSRLACIGPNDADKPYRFTTITQPDGTKLHVFVVRSLRIPSGITTEITQGEDPIAIVALDKIEIDGTLSVSSIASAGGYAAPNDVQNGNGPGGGKVATSGAGDGGGGYCGKGGNGPGTGGGVGGVAYGTTELSPLLGGSSGGGSFAGRGGGAIQLVAKNLIRISTGGSINMGGRGSDTGGAGSGGAILLEANEVVVAGKIAANGGGGGAGTGPNDGKDGQLDSTPTPEGTGDERGGGGGKGGAGTEIDGQPGALNSDYPDGSFAGNGGGGAGRIRINTRSGAATVSGLVSPALSSSCATQGKLGAL